MKALEADSQFLANNNLMDFSLLLIKAKSDINKNHSAIENDIMPALIFLKEQNGQGRLELRNSINIVDPKRMSLTPQLMALSQIS